MENRNPPRPPAKCIYMHLAEEAVTLVVISDASIMVTCHELSHDVLQMIKPWCMGLSMQGTRWVRGKNCCSAFIREAGFYVTLYLLPQSLFLSSFLRMRHLIPDKLVLNFPGILLAINERKLNSESFKQKRQHDTLTVNSGVGLFLVLDQDSCNGTRFIRCCFLCPLPSHPYVGFLLIPPFVFPLIHTDITERDGDGK